MDRRTAYRQLPFELVHIANALADALPAELDVRLAERMQMQARQLAELASAIASASRFSDDEARAFRLAHSGLAARLSTGAEPEEDD